MSFLSTPYSVSAKDKAEIHQDFTPFTDTIAASHDKPLHWRQQNIYYYQWLDTILKSVVSPNETVLHIGCECGDILSALEPSYGLGIDPNPEAIALARQRFPGLEFKLQNPHDLDMDQAFENVIIANSIGQWHDIQRVLDKVHDVTNPDSRVIITYYNYLWEGVLRLASRLRLRRPLPYQNWLPPEDVTNMLYLSGFEVVRTASYVMLPVHVPVLSALCNHVLSLLPGFRHLNLITMLVARPLPKLRPERSVSVSVIVPCRNERGNIEDAVQRIPVMGKETEIIFIDGNSTDGTVSEIEQQIKTHPERNIRLIHQGTGIGKGDAVRKGFVAAQGEVLVIQDADLTAPPEDLPKFLHAWCEGKGEFINGSRLVYPLEKQAMRFLNLLANKLFGVLFTWLLGQRFRDTLCGTKMISKKHYERIAANRTFFGDFDPFGDFDLIFGAVKQNLKVVEVPVRYRARSYGKTNISRFRHGWLLVKMSWLALRRIKCLRRAK
jgi:SAM-dependent methyltransferase